MCLVLADTQTELRISRRAADRLRTGHLWVYRTELMEPSAGTAPETAAPLAGSLVTVLESTGRPLGTALYSSSSQIALRLVSRTPALGRDAYLEDLRTRVAAALARRRAVAPLSAAYGQETNAQRLLFAEADEVPGIVADRYGSLVIVQLLTQATAQDDVRNALAAALGAELAHGGEALTVWERPDPRIRELEELPPPPEGPLLHLAGNPENAADANIDSTLPQQNNAFATPDSAVNEEPPTRTTFLLNGLRFAFDATAGQKTGAFLDQRLNYAAAAKWVERSGHTGHALDVCTYQGGFALHLARVCDRVTGVDQSRAALETADRNLAENEASCGAVDWLEADAFDLLRVLEEASRPPKIEGLAAPPRPRSRSIAGLPVHFDAIVLDPPAFAKSRRAAEGALRGYKELNLRALRLLVPGGTLITCSCSHHISLEAFIAVITEAAADAGRRVQLLETRAAAPDHPEVLNLPETRYLKCLICRVE